MPSHGHARVLNPNSSSASYTSYRTSVVQATNSVAKHMLQCRPLFSLLSNKPWINSSVVDTWQRRRYLPAVVSTVVVACAAAAVSEVLSSSSIAHLNSGRPLSRRRAQFISRSNSGSHLIFASWCANRPKNGLLYSKSDFKTRQVTWVSQLATSFTPSWRPPGSVERYFAGLFPDWWTLPRFGRGGGGGGEGSSVGGGDDGGAGLEAEGHCAEAAARDPPAWLRSPWKVIHWLNTVLQCEVWFLVVVGILLICQSLPMSVSANVKVVNG